MSTTVPLKDISISSVGFKSKIDFKDIGSIEMELHFSLKEKILLKGRVIRISKDDSGDSNYVAVQFSPFGSDEKYNSPHSYSILKELINECQKSSKKYQQIANME